MTSPTPAEAVEAAAKIAENYVDYLTRCAHDYEDDENGQSAREYYEMADEVRAKVCEKIRAYAAGLPTTGDAGVGNISDEGWERALNCALSQFERHYRQGGCQTSDQRRRTLDDALQHAVGLLQARQVIDDTPSTAEALARALSALLPVAEWATSETSPPDIDRPLLDAAYAALAAHRASAAGQDKP